MLESYGLTWTGLVYGVVFLLMLLGLLIMRAWPRYQNGKLMGLKDATEAMAKKPQASSGDMKKVLMWAVMIIATIGLALSKPRSAHHHEGND